MTLLEWIKKNVPDGVDTKDAEKMIADLEELNPLNSVKTQEEALQFIERNKVFKSALDAETSKRVEKHDEKFKAEKLPELLKEERKRIEKELKKPTETDAQKAIRELEEYKAEVKRKEDLAALKMQLRESATKLSEEHKIKFDPLLAEDFSVFGEKAEEVLSKHVKNLKTMIDNELSVKLKGQWKPGEPETTQDMGSIDERILDAKKSGNLELASKLLVRKQTEQK